ncbi:RagB/SusD family nutrient uptake outer membrane protein [Mucilaginibacter celer]|uniref:RagB/SusD family nutrient uptake outer membrane protein n=1 Tax=Mucilaginibacter celer TaxID=2305508 RepID=A0A494VTY6_9SPHI|nr:RagB/SusD family nutrient uptake outer membrane protein [Mucilaginibacter celer]AYL94402.1 RagB/SusD family nutrient uptake outer membrane protein [Mucilaginibacter celer]
MKTKYIVIIAAMLSAAASSCKKELYQNPLSSKDLGKFITNQAETEEYVTSVYGTLQSTGLYGLYLPAFAEIPSDNTFDQVPSNDSGNYGQLDQFTTIPPNDIVETTWRDSYQGIQKANVVLNRIDKITYTDPAVKQARKGEMLFIRALLYFNMVRLYGDVPLVTTETTDPNQYFGLGRQPAAKVYDQIKADLTAAIPLLPDVAGQPGRVIKTAAESLLGKVYLTLKDYTNAETQLQAVVNSGRHVLMAKPQDVFAVSNENNKEIIFAVQFTSGLNGNSEGSIMFQQFSPSATVTGAKGHNLPTLSLYNLYTAGDLRKGVYVTLAPTGAPFDNKLTAPTTVITDGPSDFVVLRYADVLLMLAEVENELGNSSQAATYLNTIRSRAGLDNTAASSQADLRDAIALERRLELIGEGHRWFDLLRTGTAISVMNKWFKDNNILITIDQHNLLMPVPQSQINTDPAIKQNPGY